MRCEGTANADARTRCRSRARRLDKAFPALAQFSADNARSQTRPLDQKGRWRTAVRQRRPLARREHRQTRLKPCNTGGLASLSSPDALRLCRAHDERCPAASEPGARAARTFDGTAQLGGAAKEGRAIAGRSLQHFYRLQAHRRRRSSTSWRAVRPGRCRGRSLRPWNGSKRVVVAARLDACLITADSVPGPGQRGRWESVQWARRLVVEDLARRGVRDG